MNRKLSVAVAGFLALIGTHAEANTCIQYFNHLASPQNFPGVVQAVDWSGWNGLRLSRRTPIILGNWTISFPPGNQGPIARLGSWESSLGSMGFLRTNKIYIEGFVCSNPVSGTTACTLIDKLVQTPPSEQPVPQGFFEQGTPYLKDGFPVDYTSDTAGATPLKFIAYTACPSNIEYAQP